MNYEFCFAKYHWGISLNQLGFCCKLEGKRVIWEGSTFCGFMNPGFLGLYQL